MNDNVRAIGLMARNEPYRHARKIPCASQTSVWLFILFWATIATGQAADTLRASFALCDTGRRITCVVDGDTFWLDGVKIRIADIDAPEISQPACREERVAGEAAKLRLLQMLNAGEFSLVSGVRDEDRYGRKLRVVSRAGKSLGEQLVQEKLARRWGSPRIDWCGVKLD
ncbi:thermonuclease family protein [Agrobacterium sp. LC34]|uniref:thermonuclease family protein n=1 Tax=Agrobacterium sp. LC34 TaxID=1643810 RepID=UPI0009E4B1A2|nr:thermonuclease family protein [Agrobacterium sp. LC34]TKT57452.1 thermonuclease family protein [Agrobacterium sp. LC34]